MDKPLTKEEIAGFNAATTTNQWNAQLVKMKKARNGALPSDWQDKWEPMYDAYLERKNGNALR